jgi:hypothetical protein
VRRMAPGPASISLSSPSTLAPTPIEYLDH